MKTFVRKIDADTVLLVGFGMTVVLENGTKIPYSNLAFYSQQELQLFGIYSFDPPVVPPGKKILSIAYLPNPEGVEQSVVFEDLPPGPVGALANEAAASTFLASLRRQGRRHESRGNASKAVKFYLKAAGVKR